MLVGRAFADASEKHGLPSIRGMTIRTNGISPEEGQRLVLRFPSSPRRAVRPMTDRVLKSRLRHAQALGIEVRQLVGLRLSGADPQAIEIVGRLRDLSTYLRVLSEAAGSPAVAQGVYYRLADADGNVALRFGIVSGFAPPDRLVGWVRPDLLSKY